MLTPDPHPLHAHTDPETGIYVERCFYAGGAIVAGEDHFWFAYDPRFPVAQTIGATGATAEEAIATLQARLALRRAA
jgi:hypothetical protein